MTLREAVVELCNAAHWEDPSGRKTPAEQSALWLEVIRAGDIVRDEKGIWR